MKLPVVSRKLYEEAIRLNDFNIEKLEADNLRKFQSISRLIDERDSFYNKNSELNIKLVEAVDKIETLEKSNGNLKQDFNDANKIIEQLIDENKKLKKVAEEADKKVEEYKKSNVAIGKIYNNVNRKLWCNEESKRQLRNLAADILESTKINKTDLVKYLEQISMRVGGGENYKFISIDEINKENSSK